MFKYGYNRANNISLIILGNKHNTLCESDYETGIMKWSIIRKL